MILLYIAVAVACDPSQYYDAVIDECFDCHFDCATCTGAPIPGNSNCSACKNPTRMLVDGSCYMTCDNNQICLSCHGSCKTCSGSLSNQCLSCPNSKYLNEGSCLSACPAGSFPQASQCRSCPDGCVACIGLNACTSCTPGFVLSQGKCWVLKCGDNIRVPGEECDDGNVSSGDGCSAECTLEQECSAPNLISAASAVPYKQLELVFDVAVYASSSDICAVFEDKVFLGQGAECSISSNKLVVVYGTLPQFAHPLLIPEGKVLTSLCSKTKSYPIQVNFELSSFSLVLSGPAKVGHCEESIVISTANSLWTHGQSSLKVNWSLVNIIPSEGIDEEKRQQLESMLQGNFDGTSTYLSVAVLPVDCVFIIKAEGFDYTGRNSTAWFKFESSSSTVPSFAPLGFQVLSPRSEDQLVLRVEAFVSERCFDLQFDTSLEFNWELLHSNVDGTLASVIDNNQYGRMLVIPAYSFKVGTHLTIKVSCWPSHRVSQMNSITFEVVYQESQLIPVFQPHVLAIRRFESVVVSAKDSIDPSKDATPFSFAWRLYNSFSNLVKACNDTEIMLVGLEEGRHTLELYASKPGRKAAVKSMAFEVKSQGNTVELVDLPRSPLITNQNVEIATQETPLTISSSSFEQLTPAQSVRFKAVYNPEHEAATETVSINSDLQLILDVAPVPFQGVFEVSPTSGNSHSTDFQLLAKGWSGEDLRYQFSCRTVDGQYEPLTDLTYFETLTSHLPLGDPSMNYKLSLKLTVFTKDAAFATREVIVTSVPRSVQAKMTLGGNHHERNLNVRIMQLSFLYAKALPSNYEYFNEARLCECSKEAMCRHDSCQCEENFTGSNCKYPEDDFADLQDYAAMLLETALRSFAALPRVNGIVFKFVLTVKELLTRTDLLKLKELTAVLSALSDILSEAPPKPTLDCILQGLDRVFTILENQSLSDSYIQSVRLAHHLYLSAATQMFGTMIQQEYPLWISMASTKLYLTKSAEGRLLFPSYSVVPTIQTFNSTRLSYVGRTSTNSQSLNLFQFNIDPFALKLEGYERVGPIVEVADGDAISASDRQNITIPTDSQETLECMRIANWTWTQAGCKVLGQIHSLEKFRWSGAVSCECVESIAYTVARALPSTEKYKASSKGGHDLELFPWLYIGAFCAFELGWLIWGRVVDKRASSLQVEKTLNQSSGSLVQPSSPQSKRPNCLVHFRESHCLLQIFFKYDESLPRPWRILIFSTRGLVILGWICHAEATSAFEALAASAVACCLAIAVGCINTILCRANLNDHAEVKIASEENFKAVLRSSPPIKLPEAEMSCHIEARSPKQAWLEDSVHEKSIVQDLKQTAPKLKAKHIAFRAVSVSGILGVWVWAFYTFCTGPLGWELLFAYCYAFDLVAIQSVSVLFRRAFGWLVHSPT